MKTIKNAVGYGSCERGAHVTINDETENEMSFYLGDMEGDYATAKNLLLEIKEKGYKITGKVKLIYSARQEAISECNRDMSEISRQNRNSYYGYCMHGGGGKKEFKKMY